MRIDAHQHFWQYDPSQYPWISDAIPTLKHDFLPEHLEPLLAHHQFNGSVLVQARQDRSEIDWLLTLANAHRSIKGVVGWLDLQAPDIATQLERYTKHAKFKGIRHVVQDETDDRFMLRPEFLRGLAMLHNFNLTYDLLIVPKQLPAAIEIVNRLPDQKFVIDHIGKPLIKDRVLAPWEADMRELAQASNVSCKVSGMVTEADAEHQQLADFRPYLEVVFDCFTPDRLMFGSDWPVCTLAGSYDQVVSIVQDYIQPLSTSAQALIMGGTATAFYGLMD